MIDPYRTTQVFDEVSLPAALRREHRTKPNVWGIIRVLDGQVKFVTLDPPSETILSENNPGMIEPEQPHYVEPLGPMLMQVEFYDRPPRGE